jgi:hypothetical protein
MKLVCFYIDKQASIVHERSTSPQRLPGARLCSASGKLRRWLTPWKVGSNATRLWVEAKFEQALFLLKDKVVKVTINLLAGLSLTGFVPVVIQRRDMHHGVNAHRVRVPDWLDRDLRVGALIGDILPW